MAEGAFKVDVIVRDKQGKKLSFNAAFSYNAMYKDFGEQVSELHAGVARAFLKEQLRKGFDKKHLRVVDGSTSRVEEQVKPFGIIQYKARAKGGLAKVLTNIYKKIMRNSRTGQTGHYKSSNVVFFRGRKVASTEADLLAWVKSPQFNGIRKREKILFVNMMPYARRLEFMGSSGKRTKRRYKKQKTVKKGRTYAKMEGLTQFLQKPNGTYFLAARSAHGMLKGSGTAKFEFVRGNELGLTSGPYRNALGRAPYRTRFKKDKRLYLYPAVEITAIEENERILQ